MQLVSLKRTLIVNAVQIGEGQPSQILSAAAGWRLGEGILDP
jgi:hypothetical protein